MLKGSIPAIITPFLKGEVDYDSFERLLKWQIKEGISGVTVCGTTGESPTLSHDEHIAATHIAAARPFIDRLAAMGGPRGGGLPGGGQGHGELAAAHGVAQVRDGAPPRHVAGHRSAPPSKVSWDKRI